MNYEDYLVCNKCGQISFGHKENTPCLRKLFLNLGVCDGTVTKLKTAVEGVTPLKTGCTMCGGTLVGSICANCGWENETLY
jgi:hypothetical protein